MCGVDGLTNFDFYTRPWSYATVDGFLSREHFDRLIAYSNELVIGREEKIFFSHKVSRDQIYQSDLFEDSFLIELYETYSEVLADYLSLARPLKKFLVDYYDIALQVSGPDFEDKIHLDVPRKLVSGVVYLRSGIDGIGTLVFDEGGEHANESIVPWVDNRAMFFCRDQSSWHSYRGNGTDNRVTLTYNACTRNHLIAKQLDKFRRFF